MAAADLKLSRRSLLGAAFAVPVLSLPRADASGTAHAAVLTRARPEPGRRVSGPVPPPAPQSARAPSFAVTKWDRALARFRRAEAALAAGAHSEDDGLYDRILGRFNRALRALARTPAPHLAA